MSNVVRSMFRAVPLLSLAGLLAGCPPVEPTEPEPVSPTPQSGVWGLHIAEVSADGLCAELAPAVEGRVVRMDVDAEVHGELLVSVLGLGMYGGHGDGRVWADAELPLPMWGYGWDLPAVLDDDGDVDYGDPVEPEEDAPADGDAEDGGESSDPPPCEIIEDEDEEYCELPEPAPELDAGVFVALDAELRHAEALSGHLVLTVSNGYAACVFDARVDGAYLGDHAELDDDVSILPAVAEPGEAPVEVEAGSEGHPAEG